MGLRDDRVAAEIRGSEIGILLQELGEREHRSVKCRDVRILGQQFGGVAAPNGSAAWFEADDGNAFLDVRSQHPGRVLQPAACAVELARGDPGQPTTGVLLENLRLVTKSNQDLDHRRKRVGFEGFRERVHPEQHAALVAWLVRMSCEQGRQLRLGRFLGEARDLATTIDACRVLERLAEDGGCANRVDRRACDGDLRDHASPARQPSQGVVVARTDAALVALVGDSGLVAGHVDPCRAVAAAALAGEAEVERLVDLGGAPALGDDGAVHHLLEDASATPGGILLISCRLVAGAHDAPAASVAGEALADTRTLMDRFDELGVGGVER